MVAVKKINNNVIICRDGTGKELIALGKGLGFGEFPREVTLAEVERTFYDVDNRFYQLVEELPPEILEFADRIVDIAKNELPYELNQNQALILADHISFALERAKKNIRVKMPLAYDVEQLYPLEYKIGKYAVQKFRKEFKIGLPKEEVVGIAMNLLNGKVSKEPQDALEETYDTSEMLEDITEIVEEHFCFIVRKESFNYSRYATHLQYLFQRIQAGKDINSENDKIYHMTREEFPEIAACVDKIASHIKEKWNYQIAEEEKLYLMLHINRICEKEGL